VNHERGGNRYGRPIATRATLRLDRLEPFSRDPRAVAVGGADIPYLGGWPALLRSTRRIAPFCPLPDLGGRRLVAPAKDAIEIGEIAEPDIQGDGADARSECDEHEKPSVENKGGEGEPFALEELVNIPRCHVLAPCDGGGGQIAVG
jgi:hypothetical protein